MFVFLLVVRNSSFVRPLLYWTEKTQNFCFISTLDILKDNPIFKLFFQLLFLNHGNSYTFDSEKKSSKILLRLKLVSMKKQLSITLSTISMDGTGMPKHNCFKHLAKHRFPKYPNSKFNIVMYFVILST